MRDGDRYPGMCFLVKNECVKLNFPNKFYESKSTLNWNGEKLLFEKCQCVNDLLCVLVHKNVILSSNAMTQICDIKIVNIYGSNEKLKASLISLPHFFRKIAFSIQTKRIFFTSNPKAFVRKIVLPLRRPEITRNNPKTVHNIFFHGTLPDIHRIRNRPFDSSEVIRHLIATSTFRSRPRIYFLQPPKQRKKTEET